MSTLSTRDVYRIAAEANCDHRTVLLVMRGGGQKVSKTAIRAAIQKLGIVCQLPDSPHVSRPKAT